MKPEERREALIVATIEAVRAHRQRPSTKQIAQAAGVAEGTIFRVFDSKDELFDAVIDRVLDPEPFLQRLTEIDPSADFETRLTAYVGLLQRRFQEIFELMDALGLVGPPERHRDRPKRDREIASRIREVFVDDEPLLRVSLDQLLLQVRLLTFAGSHHHISDEHILTPEQVVDTILHGVLKRGND
ncbi:TetR/AcrR family transcriptional regulator [Flexivirga sp. ID2601S]|uniref:TetR/AcrR family transcriptional regulator n=2 Tax=Flexivirga aerilata TaxID=1656889 RepID=A0A849ADZ9_9MICO|nr:TetR/AcrR family transcriptional regulator [Flexivirga aerilata]NNG38659.1 TetR/AcrR family transcriptional regulator [Flexivirga aerilata]